MAVLASCRGNCLTGADLDAGVRAVIDTPGETIDFRRASDGTLFSRRLAAAAPAEISERQTRNGILPVRDTQVDGATIITELKGPAFTPPPLPNESFTRYELTVAGMGKSVAGVLDVVGTNEFVTVRTHGCDYRTQVLITGYYELADRNQPNDALRQITRIYYSPELGMPLRWEFFSDLTFRDMKLAQTFLRLDRQGDSPD